MPGTASKPRAPTDTGTGAHLAASGWNTPLAAGWADSRIGWREGSRAENHEAVVIPLMERIFKIDFPSPRKKAIDKALASLLQ